MKKIILTISIVIVAFGNAFAQTARIWRDGRMICQVANSDSIVFIQQKEKQDSSDIFNTTPQDLVVYGKIFTADKNNTLAEAFVVKNGKFVYVGDRDGASEYITTDMKIIDHTYKGLVIPGCYESHAHYIKANAVELMDGPNISITTHVDTFMQEIKAAYQRAKSASKSNIYGFGWLYQLFEIEGIPTRQQLDSICPDVALFISDSEGHKGLANTLCLQNAGILDKDGNVLISEIRGGEICMTNGKPNGLVKEQAATYVRARGIDFNELCPTEAIAQALELTQQQLNENGYISYMDGWSNVFGTTSFYDAAESLDRQNKLNILVGLSYEFESSCADINAEIAKAVATKKYTKGHVNANYIKLFMDGTVETGTGFTTQEYPDKPGYYGIVNWEENEVADITHKANAYGMTMHIHTMGDAAVHRVVNAFEATGKKEFRNTIVHTRNVLDEDYQRIADNGIVAVSGMLWHAVDDEVQEHFHEIVPANIVNEAYPMKSYFDHKVVMTSHSDYPATSDAPNDPFGIIEIAVSGSMISHFDPNKYTKPWWTEELITREQALQALTLNGAYQMHLEKERGSIEVGKYADFVLTNQDFLNCSITNIHKTKVVSTWFEGKQVYQAKELDD